MTDVPPPNPAQPSQPGPVPGQPYPQPGTPQLPPPTKKRGKTALIVVGAIVAVVLLCCGIGAASIIGAGKDAIDAAQESSASPSTNTSSPATAPTTASPSPTAAPSLTTASPIPSPTAKPRVIKGRGDDVVEIPPLTELAIVVFQCPKCTSNTVLISDGPEGLLVNEIGGYSGKRWINLDDSSMTTQFEVKAAGSWTLTIGTVAQLATKAPDGKASGKGDDVILLGGTARKVKITHSKGSSNFAIHAYSLETGRGGLLVNEIGGYSGTRPLQAPALVQVTADGNWTITPA